MTLETHIREALRDAAARPCHRSNCGSVCRCGSCHARIALEMMGERPPVRKKGR